MENDWLSEFQKYFFRTLGVFLGVSLIAFCVIVIILLTSQ